jgi:hypothetical protein
MPDTNAVHGSPTVNAAIQQLGSELSHRASDPLRRQATFALDGPALDEARRAACARVGLSLEAYQEAIASDPSLVQLEKLTIDQAVSGPVDPGPHDAISRESASGSVANTHDVDGHHRS